MPTIPEEDERPINSDSLPQVEPQYNNAPIENAPAAPVVPPAAGTEQSASPPVLPETPQGFRFNFFGKKLFLGILLFFIFAGAVVASVFF